LRDASGHSVNVLPNVMKFELRPGGIIGQSHLCFSLGQPPDFGAIGFESAIKQICG